MRSAFEIVYFAGVSLVAIFGPRFWLVGKKYGFVTPSEMLGAALWVHVGWLFWWHSRAVCF